MEQANLMLAVGTAAVQLDAGLWRPQRFFSEAG